jgi:hypothetical protein
MNYSNIKYFHKIFSKKLSCYKNKIYYYLFIVMRIKNGFSLINKNLIINLIVKLS